MSIATRQITVRMPIEVLDKAEASGQGNVSRFIIEAVREKIDRDTVAKAVATLSCLADDPAANDISDFAPAQKKVMSRGD